MNELGTSCEQDVHVLCGTYNLVILFHFILILNVVSLNVNMLSFIIIQDAMLRGIKLSVIKLNVIGQIVIMKSCHHVHSVLMIS